MMDFKLKEVLQDYKPPQDDELLFTDDDNDLLLLKDIVYHLETYDRTILLLYCELGTMGAVANELSVSHTAVIKKLDQIKLNVMGQFYERKAEALNKKITRKIHGDNT